MAVFDKINYTYSSGVSPQVIQFYEKTLLKNAKPELLHGRDAQKRTLPLHNGKRVNFRRFTPFPAITTSLSEGVTPDGQTLTMTSFSAMVKPYGGHVEITDEMQWYMLDNNHKEAAKLLSDQANLSIDTIERDALHAGLNVQFNGGNTVRSTITAAHKLTAADIKTAVRTLKRKNAKPFSDGFFHCIVHPDVVYDLTDDALWKDISKYQDQSKIEKYEIGTMYKVKFYESTNAKVFEPQTYLYGATVTEWVLASKNDTAKSITLHPDTVMTEDIARNMTGKLVYVTDTVGGNVMMCIERIDVATKTVYFRWFPASAVSANWTTTNTAKIVPTGGGASNVDVYSTIVYGADAFGDIELDGAGKNVSILINPPGSSGALDPLAQRGTIAWKVKGFCSVIVQDDFIVRIEHGATA